MALPCILNDGWPIVRGGPVAILWLRYIPLATGRIGAEFPGPDGETFRISDFAGGGAFGQVFRAEGIRSAKIVAIKLLPLDDIDDPTARLAILNEIQLARSVIHPNVLRILATSDEHPAAGEPFMMMEFAKGGSLKDLLRGLRDAGSILPLPRAKEMMTQIARGTQAINERLVHRDIKPDNILLDDEILKIADFGISKLVAHRTRSGTFKGGQAVAYMAPEGWLLAENTPQMDVYSVGLVFYELLALKHPLAEFVPNPASVDDWRSAHLYRICRPIREFRSDVDLAMTQLLSRMVAKRAMDRPAWNEVLLHLSDESPDTEQRPTIVEIAHQALLQHQANEQTKLAAAERLEQESRMMELYRHACEQLVESFVHISNEFNLQYQHGQISIRRDPDASASFLLPNGRTISCRFFQPRETSISIRGSSLAGGGYLVLENGPGANLLYLRDSREDVYGKWVGCYIGISPLVHPQAVLGRRGLSTRTVIPFAFTAQNDFYEEIVWAAGGMHVFTYDLRDKAEELFTNLLGQAFR